MCLPAQKTHCRALHSDAKDHIDRKERKTWQITPSRKASKAARPTSRPPPAIRSPTPAMSPPSSPACCTTWKLTATPPSAATPWSSTNPTSKRFEVTQTERQAAVDTLEKQTRADTEFAIENVRRFAQAQLATILPLDIEPLPGLHLGHRVIPIERVGAYVPGGRFPLLSAPS